MNTEVKGILTDRFKRLKCCVLIPTYNNDTTLQNVINDVLQYTHNVIIINDGSTDKTNEILRTLENIEIVSYQKNQGKGYAIQQGFKRALALGYEYAITLDSDGQHYAKDLETFIDALEKNPNSLFIGNRYMDDQDQPKSSGFANKFSNFWFKVETGISLPDTQSGYRLYPIKLLEKKRWFCKKYEFEIESIVRAAWSGLEVKCIPIDVFYPDREERISHFRPFMDFFRISVLNTILVTLAFLIFRPRMILREFKGKSLRQIWKEKVDQQKETKKSISAAIGFGVFMGIFPVWGYQLLIGFIVAHLLKLNKAIFFIAANISIPPMIPFILYLSYVIGGFALGEGSWKVDVALEIEAITSNLKQYLIGAVCLSLLMGTASYFISYVILSFTKKNNA